MTSSLPTEQDRRNAAVRAEIAARFQADYEQCLAWAEPLFGQGFIPAYRHYLVDHDDEERCRQSGGRPPAAATVYTVRNAAGDKRHFMLKDGRPVEVSGYTEGFGDMLYELHPTRGFEHQGKRVAYHRYSLCFAAYHDYHPKSAEQLAADRATREARAVDRLAEANPLFEDEIRAEQAQPERRRRGRQV
jgi:hypothetical protein